MITAITCTGDRPEAFSLCRRWLQAQQTDEETQWIVVDDGKIPIADPPPWGEYFRREHQSTRYHDSDQAWHKQWKDGVLSLAMNTKLALEKVRGNKIVFIEDDDYYPPSYLAQMSKELDNADIVGMNMMPNYHVRDRGYIIYSNTKACTTASTGFRAEHIETINEAVEVGINQNYTFDALIWWAMHLIGAKLGYIDDFSMISIKGMPGRGGITASHYSKQLRPDPAMQILRDWIGADADVYEEFYSESSR